ncbi:hypothetical protein BASA81_017770 [Batrachochytrium salamandrivorans]|nr:hypothetical protein BASA81_017770 [Batrachochytrium salamandrivorans]
MERENRVKRGLCLVCGETGHRKVNCPKSRFKFKSDSSKNIHAIQTESMKQQNPREPIRLSSKKQLSSARQFSNFDTLDMDMMKTVDCKVHECDESDDVARGVLGRLENMLLLPGTLHFGSAIHADTFFIDCGADVFMDAELATRLNIPLVKIPVPIKLRLADGDSSSMITHRTLPLQLHIGRHVETIGFYVTSLCHGIILGGTLGWRDTIHKSIGSPGWWILDPIIAWRIVVLGRLEFKVLESLQEPRIFRPRLASRNKSHPARLLILPWIRLSISVYLKTPVWISIWVSKSQYFEFPKALRNQFHLPKQSKPKSTLSWKYPRFRKLPFLGDNKEFSSVFSESQANILPLHRSFDCTINLSSSAEPPYGRIYQLTREEDKVMQEWISENLAKGFIRNSSSPYGAPCFFVKQKETRLCMDYRGLNKQTVKDRNPIPLISEMLRTLSIGKSSRLWISWRLYLLRIKRATEPKTAFITKYGQFEFLVMPFGLANAPAQFQRMMNSLFRHMISKFVLVYLDDIVVYSDNLEDHKEHVRQVLQILKDNNLFCKAEKCHFYQTEIKYLGYIISPNGTSMDPSKISAVQDWPAPKKVCELQVFLGFTNFYRALVSGYSDITCHLTKLLKKDVPFSWGPEQETSFKKLKDAFARPGFLAHPNDEQPFILETDASDFAISGVLHQHDQTNTLRPVAFYSRQMNNAERNYDIYDKELLAVVDSFKHWRHLLQGGLHPVTVLCDHKNLEYFMSTKKLTRRQARWSLELSEYTFTITHRPGKLNGRADSLSRREDYFLDGDQIREMTEAAVAAFLYDLMMNYGAPFEIISDRGKSFLAEGISEFERENSIRHLATTPYHPQTNGMVERMHAMLGHGLTTLVADKRDRWDEYLPQVLWLFDSDSCCTGFSPFYLLFGTHPRLPNDETPPRSSLMPLDEIERMEENSEFIARNLEEVGQARSAANVRTRLKLKQCENETDLTRTLRIITSKLAIW